MAIRTDLHISQAWSFLPSPALPDTLACLEGGPDALLGWLEDQLGLVCDAHAWAGRVTEYAALLEAVPDATYAVSLATDRWATAATLLARRDELRFAGWDGGDAATLPPIVRDLARAERGPRRVRAATAERLDAVRAALEGGQVLPDHLCRLREEISLWPPAWRPVLRRLNCEPCVQGTPQGRDGSALRRVQDAIYANGDAKVEMRGDGSIRWLAAESVLTACEAVSALLAAEPDALAGTAVYCPDPAVAIRLDTCLARLGLPTMGASAAMRALPVFQVLPLVLQLCWEPVDPHVLLDFVSLPLGPIPPATGRRLAYALAEQPGLDSAAWTEVRASLESPGADPRGRIAERLALWFDVERQPYGTSLPPDLVMERCGHVASWAFGRASLLEQEPEDAVLAASLRALQAQAATVKDLAASHGGPISEAQLTRLLEAAEGAGAMSRPQPEREGGPWWLASPAELARPVARLVWLGLGADDAPACPWTTREVRALKEAGVEVDDGLRLVSVQRQAERCGLGQVTQRLLAVSLPVDEEQRPHPLWLQIERMLREEGKRVAAGRPLGRMLAADRTAELEPWRLATETRTVEGPQPRRVAWDVAGELLEEREHSSASSLEARLGCPLKWVFHYQAGLHASPIATLPESYRLWGNFCHQVLADVFGTEPVPIREDEALAAVAARFDARVGKDAAPLAQPASMGDRRSLRESLLDATRRLVRALDAGGYRVSGMEVPVEGRIAGRVLRGSIDCLLVREDGEEGIIDFKYGARDRHTVLKEGRAIQLATYAAGRGHETEREDACVAYLLLATGMLHTPEGSPLRGAPPEDVVDGAPAIGQIWRRFVAALRAADEWMTAGSPVVARPLQDPESWPEGWDLVLLDPGPLEKRGYAQPVCRYCDYAALCGLQELE